jgi:hypothetical protein
VLAGGIAETRADIVHAQGFTEVVFRRRGMIWRLLRLLAFAVAWMVGLGFAALMASVNGEQQPLFYVAWMALWGVGGGIFLLAMLDGVLGVHSLVARADGLSLVHRLLLWRHATEFAASSIRSIDWISDDPTRKVTHNGRRIPQTGIRIVSESMTRYCGRGIGEADARAAIAALAQRLVIRRSRD